MKLYSCSAVAIRDDPSGFIVAENQESAEEKFKLALDEEGIWYTGSVYAREISEVDGYKIILVKT